MEKYRQYNQQKDIAVRNHIILLEVISGFNSLFKKPQYKFINCSLAILIIRSFYIVFVLISPLIAAAQLKKVANMTIDDGATFVAPYFEKISDTVRLVGLGALQGRLKEPTALNNAITCYLIKNKDFNKMLINASDWEIRPFSNYMYGDKDLIISEFDSLFNKTFIGSSYYTREFRNFFIWLKKYNLSNKSNKVLLVGGGLLEDRNKFPAMNNYFINTYVSPFNQKAADSLSRNWEAAKTKSAHEFDFIVLSQMFDWKEAVNNEKIPMPDALKFFMDFDYSQRRASYESTLLNTSNSNNTTELYHAGKFKFGVVEVLMKDKFSKTIIHTNNMEIANAEVYLKYDDKDIELPFNGIEYKKLYKGSYLNTATTFADSAIVWGMENNVEKKTMLYGDYNTQTLLQKKPVYIYPQDNAELLHLTIPILNKTVSKNYELYLKNNGAVVPFDMVFIFDTITPDKETN